MLPQTNLMKYILLFFAIIITTHATAQRAFYGRVTDKNQKAIPFCVVQVKDRNEGVYTGEDGKFFLIADPDSAKAFVFYCLGFEKKEITIAGLARDSMHIELKPSSNSLKTVVFTEKTGKQRKRVLGKKRMKHISDSYGKYGDEDVAFLKADGKKNGLLKEVRVFITNEGVPDSKFRIHVYEKDPLTNLPATEITDSNLIVHANKGNEWVKADLGSKRIRINDGVFVSVEWVSGHGNSEQAMQSAKHAEVKAHNGQVLGLALNYGVPYMYHRNGFHNEWIPIKANHLCPMIYGVYTYIK